MALRVNGELIPEAAIQYELDRLVKFYSDYMTPEKIKEQMDALRKRAREQAIGAKLLIREADRLNLKVSPVEVDATLKRMESNAGGVEAFDRLLRTQNLTRAGLRAGIERGRKVDVLVDRVTSEVADPTELEIREHFEQHADEYTKPERAQAQHILLKPASESEADRAVAWSRLQEIRQRVEEGADFSEMAAAHSECPSGKKAGGSLGWFGRGATLPQIDQAVFSMQVGALSEIVQTPLGLHIFKKIGEDKGGAVLLEDVSDKIREFLRHVRRGEALSAYVEELKKKAVIEEE